MTNVALINVANRSSDQTAIAPIGWDPAIVQPYVAEGVIIPKRVVAFGANDDTVVQSTAAADLHIGVYMGDVIAAIGDQAPVAISGMTMAEAGGDVTRGQRLGVNADGQVVTAVATNQVIGIALKSGVATDLIPILITHSTAP